MTSVARTLLHPCEPGERTWKYLLPVLALAFAARAAIALSGDFLLRLPAWFRPGCTASRASVSAAHKPMTEFVATALLVALLAL